MIRGLLGIMLLAAACMGALADDISEGDAAFEASDYQLAELKYKAAIADDRKAVRAYIGLARTELVLGRLDAAADAIKTGLKYDRETKDKLDLRAVGIRVEDARGDNKAAKRHYRSAKGVRGWKEHAEIHVALARVYLAEQDFDEAEELLNMALAAPGDFGAEAEGLLANLQLIEKAVAITDSPFAYVASVSRGEVAALLVDDLDIAAKLDVSTSKATLGETSDQGLTDYANSPFKDAIVQAHRLGLRSFRITNGAFSPRDPVTRAQLAMLIEDILFVKFGVSRTQFIGTESPFSDLSASDTAFNGMMTAVTRGLMQGNRDGTIKPDALVSGAEAILVLHELGTILGGK